MAEAKLKSVLPELGRILRLLRENSSRTLDTVATTAGISISMLSQIERGVVSPSIDTLCMVCRALDGDIAGLFSRLAPASPVRIHKAHERLTMKQEGVCYEQLMTSTRPAVPFEMFLLRVEQGRSTMMSGSGHEGTEMGYVMKGRARLIVGNEEYTVSEGDSICFDAHLPHRLYNTGKREFLAIWSISPPHVDYLKGEPGNTSMGKGGTNDG
ncbi:MAG: cupin domain-containing protein [Chitinispirillaceae bacterium]|nr:cupin domain-containing protein [Chitinispirillaceae bacterium]